MADEPNPQSQAAAALARHERGSKSGPLEANPQLRKFFECYLETFIFNGSLDPKLRQLAILRVLWRCGRAFEWRNHYELARQVGLDDRDVLAIRTSDPAGDLSGDAAVIVRAVDEVVDVGRVSPATLERCGTTFPGTGQLFEFLYLISGYRMIATVSASTDTLERRERAPLWPPDGVGPPANQA